MPRLILCRPNPSQRHRSPFIFTTAQVRDLLAATGKCQEGCDGFSGETFHLLLLLLYATGATVSEALTLRQGDVIPGRNCIRLGSNGRVVRSRIVPVSPELIRRIRERTVNSPRVASLEALLFTNHQGNALNRNNLAGRFRKLLSITAIPRGIEGDTARMQDLRFTFAVHRLDAWIKRGSNMHEMIPALSAYMGYSSLTKAEQFLDFVPERFRPDLEKLSPRSVAPRWSRDAVLMRFLSQL